QPLVRAFSWPSIRHRVTVDGVVTVVDAPAVIEGRFTTAAGAPPGHDDPVEELFEDQLRCADLVIIGKADLMSPDALKEVEGIISREARQGTTCLQSSRAGLAPELILGLTATAESNMAGRESHHDLEGEEHDHDDFTSFVVAAPPFASLEQLRSRVAE